MKAPNGLDIIGTSDLIPGTALIDDDGDFVGETDVCGDAQETITRGGQLVYVDENGDEWLKCELIPDDAEPVPLLKRKAWHENEQLRAIEVQDTIEKLFNLLGKKDPTMVAYTTRQVLTIPEVAKCA